MADMLYRKKLLQPMRPYVPGEDMSGISVNAEDTPEEGGMIAWNPDNPADQWYVAKKFFEDNYEAVEAQTAPPTVFGVSQAAPSVGRIVHYVAYGTPGGEYPSVCRAAIVTEAKPDSTGIGLAVLNPTGIFFNPDVQYGANNEPGTWHWPERV